MNQYMYVSNKWLDQIVEVDEYNRVVYEKDDAGNIVYWKDNFGNYVLDPVTKQPIPKPSLLQIGTRHTAARENNQEQGILKSHQRLDVIDDRLLKKDIMDEINNKTQGSAGSFADAFDDSPTRIIRQIAVADITSVVTKGTTELPVNNTNGFVAFTEITVYDGTNSEDVLITAIGDGTITVQALTHDYVKGARIARSNAKIADGQMTAGDWSTYSVAVMEVV